MIRERVNIHGVTRDMEPREELACLQISPSQIGLIKEAPALRWNKGQEHWDRLFAKEAQRTLNHRKKIARKAEEMLRSARDQGLYLVGEEDVSGRAKAQNASTERSTSTKPVNGSIQEDRRWGPLDLDDERPPPSAIAKRRDTVSAGQLQNRRYLIFSDS